MRSIDAKTLDPVEFVLKGHDVAFKHNVPQVDWTEQEEKRAKLK